MTDMLQFLLTYWLQRLLHQSLKCLMIPAAIH